MTKFYNHHQRDQSEQLRDVGDETPDKGTAPNEGRGSPQLPLETSFPLPQRAALKKAWVPAGVAHPLPEHGPNPHARLPHTPHRKRPTHIFEHSGEGTASPTPHSQRTLPSGPSRQMEVSASLCPGGRSLSPASGVRQLRRSSGPASRTVLPYHWLGG